MVKVYQSFAHAQSRLTDIEAIDYFLAKQIAKQLACDHLDVFHLLMALSASLRQGHSCLPISSIAGLLWASECDESGVLVKAGYQFAEVQELAAILVQLKITATERQPVVFDQEKLYLRRYFLLEQELAECIKARQGVNLLADVKQKADCLATLFPDSVGQSEIDWQLIAVANALVRKFAVIAGGPGTGKTYTVTKLLAALLMLSPDPIDIKMVAPTGKAAQRLSESMVNSVNNFSGQIAPEVLAKIPLQAQTIHRLLGVIPNSVQFKHHQDKRLNCDVLIIDEVSMVDLALMTRLFRALDDNCQVIMLGDADQLPSVMAGSVLADIAPRPHLGYSVDVVNYLVDVTQQTVAVNTTQPCADHLTLLTKSRRFDGEGGIGKLAKAVICGDDQSSWQLLSDGNSHVADAYLLSVQDNWLAALAQQYYQPIFACADIKDAFAYLHQFRILCATRQGELGVKALNEKITALLHLNGQQHQQGIFHGQPIMISENHYPIGLYNGDTGIIWRNEHGHLMAVFEDAEQGYRWIMPSRLPQFETVYAMTIHKTQGSEFAHVVMVLPEQADNKLLSRELLYTGITRAKQRIAVVSSKNVWQQAVKQQVIRYSGLKEALQ